MTIPPLLRKVRLRRRSTCLAIVVLPEEAAAFQAYRLLQYHGISPEHLAIVGRGHTSPEQVGLLRPSQIAIRTSRRLALNACVMSMISCLIISVFWQIELNLIFVVLLTGILSAILGAILGAMLGFWGEGTTASIYRHHLNEGRYLLLMEGSESLVRWGKEVLGSYPTLNPH